MKTTTNSEQVYLGLLKDVLKNGKYKDDRTKTGTKSVFGRQVRFDLSQGFPLLTTKKMFIRGIIHELLWFLKGDSNIKYLVDNNVNIWNEWPYKNYLQKTKGKKLTQEEFIENIKNSEDFEDFELKMPMTDEQRMEILTELFTKNNSGHIQDQ